MTAFIVAVFVLALVGLAGSVAVALHQLALVAVEAAADVAHWCDTYRRRRPRPRRRPPLSHVHLLPPIFDQEIS